MYYFLNTAINFYDFFYSIKIKWFIFFQEEKVLKYFLIHF